VACSISNHSIGQRVRTLGCARAMYHTAPTLLLQGRVHTILSVSGRRAGLIPASSDFIVPHDGNTMTSLTSHYSLSTISKSFRAAHYESCDSADTTQPVAVQHAVHPEILNRSVTDCRKSTHIIEFTSVQVPAGTRTFGGMSGRWHGPLVCWLFRLTPPPPPDVRPNLDLKRFVDYRCDNGALSL
jgi:hypothetical protein